MTQSDFTARTRDYQSRVEAALAQHLPDSTQAPERLHAAMRYACLNGGKRLRAMLVYAAGETLNVPLSVLDPAACAVEMIHAYSLVHDDLPAMDDDTLRRGQPTCHIAFDQATAILAGDALQTLAFEILSGDPALSVSATVRVAMIRTLAHATGAAGLAGGQALDLAAVGRSLQPAALQHIHERKTGALIRASVALGALASEREDAAPLRDALDGFASRIGLAFQIVDDVLDDSSDPTVLGKTPGSDRSQDKPTYASILGPDASRRLAQDLYEQALASLQLLGDNATTLRRLAELFVNRSY